MAVVVGDVIGHGVDAVAVMAQLQYLAAGLLRSGTPLECPVLDHGIAMTQPDGRSFASAQLLHIDLDADRIGCLNAGHPWALLRDPSGTVRMLPESHQPLIGVDLEPTPLTYVGFPSGSLVCAYTDGLVERRDETIVESIEALGGSGRRARPDQDADTFLTGLVAGATAAWTTPGSEVNDDVAAILVRAI